MSKIKFVFFVLVFLSLNQEAPAYSSQYLGHRSATLERKDPRLKHLPHQKSRKSESCLRWAMGVCTLTKKEEWGSLRYHNQYREQEKSRHQEIPTHEF